MTQEAPDRAASSEIKNIYLTGATGGIGSAIARILSADAGYRIVPIVSRLENSEALEAEVKDLLVSKPPFALIHAAGFGEFRPHEELSSECIQKMIQVNLTAPILLARLCIRFLRERQGHIIHIASVEATRASKWSALYSATKAGLRSFSLCLFEELRKSGIRVSCINPDLTRTGFFDDLSFKPSDDPDAAIDPEELALLVLHILESKSVISELTIRPLKASVDKQKKPDS